MKRALVVAAFFVGLILLWKAETPFMNWSPLLLPPPEAVARYLWGALLDGTLVSAAIVTIQRLVIGYFVGVAIGMGSVSSSARPIFSRARSARWRLGYRPYLASAGCRSGCYGSVRPKARCCSS